MKLVGFVVLDILEPVDDTATDLEVGRSCLKPAPPFEGAGAQAPAPREMNLIEMSDIHSALQCD